VAVAHPCDDVSLRGAAAIKKIVSPVAGRANVLVVPDLEAGNMLAKSLSFLSQAEAAGIVLGALGADFRRAAASITATAQEARRVTRESARLVKMIGTRADSFEGMPQDRHPRPVQGGERDSSLFRCRSTVRCGLLHRRCTVDICVIHIIRGPTHQPIIDVHRSPLPSAKHIGSWVCMRAIVDPLNFKLRPTVLLAENLLQLRANSLRSRRRMPPGKERIAVSTSFAFMTATDCSGVQSRRAAPATSLGCIRHANPHRRRRRWLLHRVRHVRSPTTAAV